MKWLIAVLVLGGGVALAQPPPEPPVPLAKKTQDARGRRHPFAPIPFFYYETDNQRVNVLAKLLAAAIACRYECNSETAYIVLAVIIRSFDADRANCEEVSA